MIEITAHEVLIRIIDGILIGLNVAAWITADLEGRPAEPKTPTPVQPKNPTIHYYWQPPKDSVTNRDMAQDERG